MKKPSSIQLNIPHPCTQNWDEMTPCGTGRFCAHCQKTVIDFTTWSDTALYNFFAKNTGEVCGRMFATQLQHPLNIPPQPHSRLYRLAVALGLTLIFGETSQAYSQNRPPKVEQIPILRNTDFSSDRRGTIAGIVFDKKQQLGNAKIEVYDGRDLKVTTTTNSNGEFIISALKVGYYNVVATFPDYDIHKVVDVYPRHSDTAYLYLRMSRKSDSATKTSIEYYREPMNINDEIWTGQINHSTLPQKK